MLSRLSCGVVCAGCVCCLQDKNGADMLLGMAVIPLWTLEPEMLTISGEDDEFASMVHAQLARPPVTMQLRYAVQLIARGVLSTAQVD